MIKQFLAAFIAAVLLLSFVSCRTVSGYSYCEMTIPLSADFRATENSDFDASWTNGDYAVAVLRLSFVAAYKEGIPETLTPLTFGAFWLERCEREANMINGNVAYCEYYDSGNFYLEAFYRSKYAYFVILFASSESRESEAHAAFLAFADGVRFTDNQNK